jgi:hypothetical protein
MTVVSLGQNPVTALNQASECARCRVRLGTQAPDIRCIGRPTARAGRSHTSRPRSNKKPSRCAPHFGPYRAPDNHVGDGQPVTDGGRVMWGLERAVDTTVRRLSCDFDSGSICPVGIPIASSVGVRVGPSTTADIRLQASFQACGCFGPASEIVTRRRGRFGGFRRSPSASP